MGWFNGFGLCIAAVIMISNIISAMKYKDGFKNKCRSKGIEAAEQTGRFGWPSGEAFAACHIADSLPTALCCLIWIACFKKNSVFRALSIIPSLLFLSSGVVSRSILLTLAAVILAPRFFR